MQRSPQDNDGAGTDSIPPRPGGRWGDGASPQDKGAGSGTGGSSSNGGGAGSSPSGAGASGGQNDGRRELLRYAGLGSQVMASVGVSVYLGVKADKWLKVSFPILSWVLPLLVIVGLIVQLIKSSSGKK